MNKRWVGFITAVCCYIIGIMAMIMTLLEDGNGIPEYLPPCALILPSLVAGIRLIAAKKWRAFQGWLIGFILMVLFTIAGLAYLFSQIHFYQNRAEHSINRHDSYVAIQPLK